MPFSQDLKVVLHCVKAWIISAKSTRRGNIKSSCGLFTLLRDENHGYFMPFCQFFFEPSDCQYCMILLEFNLDPWKLKYISFSVKFQSLLAAVECVASIKSTFTNILSKDAKRFVNLTFFIVFPKRRKLFISLSQGIFLTMRHGTCEVDKEINHKKKNILQLSQCFYGFLGAMNF